MPNLLAICDNPNCRTIFKGGSYLGEGVRGIFINSKYGPCPNCGSMGSIPDGEYLFQGGVLNVVPLLPKSLKELKFLRERLRAALLDSSKMKNTIEELTNIAPNLKIPVKNKAEIHTWIMSICAIITLALLIYSTFFDKNKSDEKYQDLLIEENRWYREHLANSKKQNTVLLKTLPSKNQPCPCGSGKQFKRCHGLVHKKK